MGAEERKRHLRKRKVLEDNDEDPQVVDEEVSSNLEEVKVLQKQRARVKGTQTDLLAQAISSAQAAAAAPAPVATTAEGEEGGEELVLQDTFAQETAVLVEDPNMVKYVEQELAKRRGLAGDGQDAAADAKSAEDELYKIPEHLKVKQSALDEGSSAWTTGIAEVALPIDFKLKNIEETEAAKKALQQRGHQIGRQRPPTSTLPASFSADYHQRGRDFAQKLRKDLPPDNRAQRSGPPIGDERRRQTATDDLVLERFRKREIGRLMRR